MTAVSAPPLPPDLAAGLKRLKLAAMRQLAPELLVTARTQRWKPEELLRTLVEAEITSRDASNTRTRLRCANFPVVKTLEEFDVAASWVPPATFDYLASLEWIRAAENLCLIGPAGTGKSHLLVALGVAAVHAGHKVRYFTAAELVETLYRGLADNSVGRVGHHRRAGSGATLPSPPPARRRQNCPKAAPAAGSTMREASASHRHAIGLMPGLAVALAACSGGDRRGQLLPEKWPEAG